MSKVLLSAQCELGQAEQNNIARETERATGLVVYGRVPEALGVVDVMWVSSNVFNIQGSVIEAGVQLAEAQYPRNNWYHDEGGLFIPKIQRGEEGYIADGQVDPDTGLVVMKMDYRDPALDVHFKTVGRKVSKLINGSGVLSAPLIEAVCKRRNVVPLYTFVTPNLNSGFDSMDDWRNE